MLDAVGLKSPFKYCSTLYSKQCFHGNRTACEWIQRPAHRSILCSENINS